MASKLTVEDAKAQMISEALRRHALPEAAAILIKGENVDEVMASAAGWASARVQLSPVPGGGRAIYQTKHASN